MEEGETGGGDEGEEQTQQGEPYVLHHAVLVDARRAVADLVREHIL